MMKKDGLEELFQRLEGNFDIETPPEQHQQRFLDKLQASRKQGTLKIAHKISYLKPLIGIAASLAIIISVVLGLQMNNQKDGLAGVSPEMASTQQFYTTTINKELQKIEKRQTPATKVLIGDAMTQMKKLESEYAKLQKDLATSGDDSRVIYAMINNFQNRINILKNVLEQIEHVEQLKQKNHENPATI